MKDLLESPSISLETSDIFYRDVYFMRGILVGKIQYERLNSWWMLVIKETETASAKAFQRAYMRTNVENTV